MVSPLAYRHSGDANWSSEKRRPQFGIDSNDGSSTASIEESSPTERELDRAFLVQDRWLKAILLPILVVIGATLFLSRSPGSPVREFLIALVFISLAAALVLLAIWLVTGLTYQRRLHDFRSAGGLPTYGPQSLRRLAVYVAAVLVSGLVGLLYFAAPQWRGGLWIGFVTAAAVIGGFLWLNRPGRLD
jgi:hypothetical protein